jgi:hypothetical protein
VSAEGALATLSVLGGFALSDVVPALPPAPLLTGDVHLAWSLGERVELRARYATHLGITHRLGPDLRVRALAAGAFWVGARLHPSFQIGGTPEDLAGDVSTQAGLLAGWGAITVEGGVTVQWLVFDPAGSDDDPYLAFVDVAVEGRRVLASGTALVARLEIAIPTAPDDPFAVLGVHPRVLFGAVWAL